AGEDQRQIFFRITIEFDGCAFGDVQIYIAFQVNGATRELACGNYHATASGSVARFDRFAKRLGAISFAVTYCAKFRDVEIPLGKDGGLNPVQNFRIENLPRTVCLRQTNHARCEPPDSCWLRE